LPRIRYHVAASLDGYIAGPHDAFDWITHEPSMDFHVYPSGVVSLDYSIVSVSSTISSACGMQVDVQ